ncbi:Helix-loop-helix DNA-binding domain protein [Aphelenchoides besseyi]|nr:Helix-loop-helix DNA-binding domain protein [Aphelenchoides besseyi]
MSLRPQYGTLVVDDKRRWSQSMPFSGVMNEYRYDADGISMANGSMPMIPQQSMTPQLPLNGSIASNGHANPPTVHQSGTKERFARENHSEIERRRRNKMTHYINELAEMVPQCAALGRKPDKLTILRMAVSHMKQIREVSCPADPTMAAAAAYKPSFLTDQELKHMILEAANGFLFVLACDSGAVLYCSDSILPVLNLQQEDWLNHSIYDLVHPDDMDKVRDQLCGSESSAGNRILDMKTGTVKKEGRVGPSIHMSCRRGFICRMRLGNIEPLHRLRNRRPLFTHNGQTYVVMHCTGYIKNTPPNGVEAPPTSCLVGVARLQVASMPMVRQENQETDQFTMRLNEEGKITFIDQRVTQLLEFRAEDFTGKYVWQCVNAADEPTVRDAFLQLVGGQQPFQLNCHWKKAQGVVPSSFSAYKFNNPYSEQFEYVVGTVQLLEPTTTNSQTTSRISPNLSNPSETNDPQQLLPPAQSVVGPSGLTGSTQQPTSIYDQQPWSQGQQIPTASFYLPPASVQEISDPWSMNGQQQSLGNLSSSYPPSAPAASWPTVSGAQWEGQFMGQ